MQPQFKPPKDEAEFELRYKEMSLIGAKNVLKARKAQRADAVKPYDQEIEFLEKVIDRKKEEGAL